jgi:bacillithiol biosynthesis deacetylase BshB1
MSGIDLLAIGAHPDDIELGVGGQLFKAAKHGLRTALLDLTRGEMASRGTPEIREAEALRASEILGATRRENARIPDSEVANVAAQRLSVIRLIRELRPRVILAPMRPDRHPDHEAAHELVRAANFYSGLSKIDTGQAPYRAPALYFYHAYFTSPQPPAFVVDISGYFDKKLEALSAHASQFYQPGVGGAETFVSTEAFWEDIRNRAAFWGSQVGVRYGEPLYHLGPVGLDLPFGLESL